MIRKRRNEKEIPMPKIEFGKTKLTIRHSIKNRRDNVTLFKTKYRVIGNISTLSSSFSCIINSIHCKVCGNATKLKSSSVNMHTHSFFFLIAAEAYTVIRLSLRIFKIVSLAI